MKVFIEKNMRLRFSEWLMLHHIKLDKRIKHTGIQTA